LRECAVGHVARDACGVASRLAYAGDGLFSGRGVNIAYDDARAVTREQLGRGPAYPAARARDDGDPSFKQSFHFIPPVVLLSYRRVYHTGPRARALCGIGQRLFINEHLAAENRLKRRENARRAGGLRIALYTAP
jgi:hypothetical protein